MTGGWTPDHLLVLACFVAVLGFCAWLLVTRPAQIPTTHDVSNRMQVVVSEMDARLRDLPRPREIRELADRISQLERVTTSIQSDLRAMRESSVRIEHQLNLLIEAGLQPDERTGP